MTKTSLPTRPEDALFVPEADDGWTLPGFFRAVPAVHPDIRFTYRPFTPAQRAIVLQAINRAKSDEDATRLINKALAQQLRSWSVGPPIRADILATLRFPIWDKLASVVVFQVTACDVDPEWGEDDANAHDQAQLESLLGTSSQPKAVFEGLEGNSKQG